MAPGVALPALLTETWMSGSIREFRPSGRPPSVREALLDPRADLRPWAAYVLGYTARSLPMWLRLVARKRDYEWILPDAEGGVPASNRDMRLAWRVLAGSETCRGAEWDETMRLLLSASAALADPLFGVQSGGNDQADAPFRGLRPDELLAVGMRWTEWLAILVNTALPRDHSARPWLDLGQDVGRAEDRIDSAETAEAMAPEIMRVARAAAAVPPALASAVPMVQLLTRLADQHCDGARVLRELYDAGPDGLEKEDWWPAECLFSHGVMQVHGKIETALRGLGRQAQVLEVPRWARGDGSDAYQLTYRGRVIKSVPGPRAKNVVSVLDAFQKANWPRSIASPWAGHSDDHHHAIVSLNRDLSEIRFGSCEGGKRIRWEPLQG